MKLVNLFKVCLNEAFSIKSAQEKFVAYISYLQWHEKRRCFTI